MATNIGTLSAKVSADSADFLAGMDRVKKSAKSTVGDVDKSLAGMGKGGKGGGFGDIGGGIKDVLDAIPLVGSMLGQIPAAGQGLFGWLRDGLKDVKETAREAQKLGLTIDEFGGLSRAAGGDAEGFAKAIAFMRKELGGIRGETSDAASGFRTLGLSGMELKQLGTIDAFGKIADQLNEFQNENEKAYAASKIFGKGYKDVGQAVAMGSAGIKDAIAQHKDIQGILSPEDIANAKTAERAIKDVEDSIKSIRNQLAVAAAPYITEIAHGLLDITKHGKDLRPVFEEWLKAGAGYAADFLDLLAEIKDMVESINVRAKDAGDFFRGALSGLTGRAPVPFAPPGDETTGLRGAANNLRRLGIGEKTGATPDKPDAFRNADTELTDAIMAQEKALQEQIAAIGKSADELARWKLVQQGATDPLLKNVDALQAQAKAMRLMDEAKSPVENFTKEMGWLNQQFKDGKLGVDGWALGVNKAQGVLEAFAGAAQPVALPQLATAGSREAFDVIARSEQSGGPQRDILDVMKSVNEKMSAMRYAAERTAENTKGLPNIKVSNLDRGD